MATLALPKKRSAAVFIDDGETLASSPAGEVLHFLQLEGTIAGTERAPVPSANGGWASAPLMSPGTFPDEYTRGSGKLPPDAFAILFESQELQLRQAQGNNAGTEWAPMALLDLQGRSCPLMSA
jgi:hypothetical protein